MKHVLSVITIAVLVFTFLTTHTKRHSRNSKIERYERRAREAAESNSSLATVLSKQTKFMTFDQARIAQDYYRGAQEQDMVIKCGERILAVGGDQEILRLTRLELAELFLAKNKYANAEKHAQDYLTYYPGAKESKKASLIVLNATYKSQSSSFKDQQKTRTTIELAQAYLEKYPKDPDHTQEVQEILDQSYLKLLRSELNIITTQLNLFTYAGNKGALPAAQKRLSYLKEKYLPHAPSAQKRVQEVEHALEAATGKQQKVTLAQAETRTRTQKVKDFFFEDNVRYFA